jgi:uncharacterized damage-inducible protein DinB
MRGATAEKKRQWIDELVAARRSLLEAVRALLGARQDEVFLGTWSVKDLLAHLVGWDATNLKAVQEILSGQYPAFFQFYDKDWHSYNARLVERYKIEPFAALLAEVEDSHRQLVGFLESLSAAELVGGKARSAKGRTVTIRGLLRAEANDERQHAGQVSAFFGKI